VPGLGGRARVRPAGSRGVDSHAVPRATPVTAVPTEEELRALASTESPDGAALSLYLDVDGRHRPRLVDLERALGDLARRARATPGLAARARAALDADLDRVARFVTAELDRQDVRGLAVFAAGPDLWRTFLLPRSVRDRVVVDRHPHVLRLEGLLAGAERFLTVLVSRERARLFTTFLGETVERTEVLDEVPGQHDQGGWSQARFQRHIDALYRRHLRHVADVAFAMLKREGIQRVVLAGPEEVVADLERGLHPWLAERVAARVALPMDASRARVREATLAVEEVLEAERLGRAIARVLEDHAAGRGAVVGLEPTLEALHAGRVDTLLVADGEPRPGGRCGACGRLAAGDRRCPACGAELAPVTDLAEEAVDEALRRRAAVLTPPEGALPEDAGALLRF
jgi:peptide chain release factor subunit 1